MLGDGCLTKVIFQFTSVKKISICPKSVKISLLRSKSVKNAVYTLNETKGLLITTSCITLGFSVLSDVESPVAFFSRFSAFSIQFSSC